MRKFITVGILLLYSVIIGGTVGILTWGFLGVVSLSTHFLWVALPKTIQVHNWTMLLCLIGGVWVGLCQKHFENYRRGMEHVMAEFKETKRVDYKSLYKTMIAAFCVLSFGQPRSRSGFGWTCRRAFYMGRRHSQVFS